MKNTATNWFLMTYILRWKTITICYHSQPKCCYFAYKIHHFSASNHIINSCFNLWRAQLTYNACDYWVSYSANSLIPYLGPTLSSKCIGVQHENLLSKKLICLWSRTFNSSWPGGLAKMGHFQHHTDVTKVLAISRRFGWRLRTFIGAYGLLRVLTFNF